MSPSSPYPPALDPEDWDAFRRSAHGMLDDALDHMQARADTPVWRRPPAALRARRRSILPREGAGLDATHQVFRTDVLPYPSGNTHPGFMGWVQGAGTPVGVLAEVLAAAMNANCGGRDHMAVEVEREVTGWTREMFAFPAEAEGLFLTGASQANFVAVLAARTRALGDEVRRTGVRGGAMLTAYAGVSAHGCVTRAMEMSGIGSDALRRVDVGADGRIRIEQVRHAVAEDRKAGFLPFLIVGAAGTVDTGAIDDLDGLADLAHAEGLNLHIDGALGALGVLSPEIKPRLKGLERADSIAFDWHKWGHAPYDAGFVLVRDGDLLRRTFAAENAYLARAGRGLAAGDWWACDHGPDLSRGFRALKVWFTLKAYGATALGQAMAYNCELARALAARIEASPDLTLLAPVTLNIVCFAHRGAGADQLNAEIVADLHQLGRVAPSLTRIAGRTAIRAAIVNHRTRMTDIDALVEGVLARGAARTAKSRTDA